MENTCKTCKYFKKYYYKCQGKLAYSGYGFCGHHYLTPRNRNRVPDINDCEDWEPLGATEEREAIANVIREMHRVLTDIESMLTTEGKDSV